jgi:hypothetical protein
MRDAGLDQLRDQTRGNNMEPVTPNQLYRDYYVGDSRVKSKPDSGFTRLWCNDSVNHPSFTGYYDVPDAFVDYALSYRVHENGNSIEYSKA